MAPFWLLAAWAAGSVLAESWPFPGSHPVNFGITAVLACFWLGLRNRRLAWLPLLAAVGFCATLSTGNALRPPPAADHLSRFIADETATLEARLATVEPRKGGQRLEVEALRLVGNEKTLAVWGRLLVTLETGTLPAEVGQVLRFRSRLRRPQRFGMPGEFDYPRHLAGKGIHVTTFIKDAEDIAVLPRHPATASDFWEGRRQAIAEQIGAAVASDRAGLVRALTVGMRADIRPQQRRLLSEGGVSHLFAISGLHFGMLGCLLYSLGSRACRCSPRLLLWLPPRRLLPPLLIGPLAGYLLLTGGGWSTLRAFSMVAILGGLLLAGRRTPPLTLLATTALLLLIANPLALFAPGFQLSFAGLAGILAWLPGLRPHLASMIWPLQGPAAMLATTGAATLATAPLVCWHFHHFAPAGLLSNLVAIPLIAWLAVPVGLVGMALSGLSSSLAAACFQACAAIIGCTLDIVGWLSSLAGLQALYLPLQTGEGLFLAGLCTAALIRGSSRRAWTGRMAIGLLALAALWAGQSANDQFRVVALSVGQGDATLLSFPDNRHFLVDGGGLPGTDFDPGERLVAPALARLGIRRLEGILLTHDHPDHRDGLVFLVEHLPVDNFWSALAPEGLPETLRVALDRRAVPIHQLPAGWTNLPAPDGHRLDLFVPDQTAANLNERSVAVLAGSPGLEVLLTADLGRDGLKQLLEQSRGQSVSLLKLPHHGSRHSAPKEFLATYRPRLAFVSAGRGNPYGFPHTATLEACREQGIPLYRTDRQGMLTFVSSDKSWRTESRFIEEID